jgi:hypothetical protein
MGVADKRELPRMNAIVFLNPRSSAFIRGCIPVASSIDEFRMI